MNTIDRILARLTIGLIKAYQMTLSPDHSRLGKLFPYRGCKFYPSCSMYTLEMLENKGFWRGIGPSLKRFSKCHPWSDGGVDLPPGK